MCPNFENFPNSQKMGQKGLIYTILIRKLAKNFPTPIFGPLNWLFLADQDGEISTNFRPLLKKCKLSQNLNALVQNDGIACL